MQEKVRQFGGGSGSDGNDVTMPSVLVWNYQRRINPSNQTNEPNKTPELKTGTKPPSY